MKKSGNTISNPPYSRLAMLVAAAALFFAAGCNPPPQHAAAFSPDGKRIAYVDKAYDGIIVHDFETGEYRKLHAAAKDTAVTGVFWPAAGGDVCSVEEDYNKCLRREKGTEAVVIRHGNGRSEVAFKQAVPCAGNELDLPLWTGLDIGAGVLEVSGKVFAAGESATAAALDEYIRTERKKSRIAFNFNLSPDGKRAAFFLVDEAGQLFPDTVVRQGFRIVILDIASAATEEVYSAPAGAFDINRENEEFQLLAFFNALRWSRDGRFLYFLDPKAGRNSLARYELQGRKKQIALKENTFLFEPYEEDRALAVFRRGGNWFAVALKDAEKADAEIPLPKVPESSRSLKVSPGGERAAFLVPISDKAIYPLVIDLKKKTVAMLVAGGPEEQIAAGDFFAKRKMPAHAAGFYEKAGPAGLAPLYRTYHTLQDSAAGSQVYRQLLDSYKAEGKDAHLNLAEKLRAVPDMYEISKREYMLAEEKNLGRALLRAATLAYKLKKPEWPDLYRKSVEYYRRRTCHKSFKGGCPGAENVTWLLHLAARCNAQKAEPCETEYVVSLADHLKPELYRSLAEKPPDRPAQNALEMPFALVSLYETLNRCEAAGREYQDMLSAIAKLPVDKQKQYAGPAADAAGRLARLEPKCPALKKKSKK